jgi:hypothetical protein
VQYLDAENRPGDRLQPVRVVDNEGITRPYRLDDVQQPLKDDMHQGNGQKSDECNHPHPTDHRFTVGRWLNTQGHEEAVLDQEAENEQTRDCDSVRDVHYNKRPKYSARCVQGIVVGQRHFSPYLMKEARKFTFFVKSGIDYHIIK